MKKLAYILFVLATFASCSKEKSFDHSDNEQMVEMKLRIGTKAENEPNTDIENVRIIVLNRNGDVKFNKTQSVEGDQSNDFTAEAREGENDFYVVCNETADMTEALNNVKNSNEIEAVQINYNSSIVDDSPVMFGQMKNVTVVSTDENDVTAYTINYTDREGVTHSGETKLPISVQRLIAKISLSFLKKEVDFTVSDLSIKVINLPKYSYLGEGKEYNLETNGKAENIVKSKSGTLLQNNTATYNSTTQKFEYENDDKVEFEDFYIPEYRMPEEHLDDMNYRSAIIVSGKCTTTDGKVINGNWRIDLMNSGLKIERNIHYKIAATICGMGAVGIYADIVPMEIREIPINWKPVDGLVIVSDLEKDIDKNVNVWNNYSQYSGILKFTNKKEYKNILFKYGSVIGIAAEGSDFTADGAIWKPKTYTDAITTWTDIPALGSGDVATENTPEGIKKGLGDPCRLVGLNQAQIEDDIVNNGSWRMATKEEYQYLINAKNKGETTENGFKAFHYNFLPNVPTRDENGLLSSDGLGRYWSGTSLHSFRFGTVDAIETDASQKAQLIRCVRVEGFPMSTFNASASNIGYKGGNSEIQISQMNVPYWKIVSYDENITSKGALEGFFNGNIPVEVAPLENKYVTRVLYIEAIGYGLDGVLFNKRFKINQSSLSHYISLNTIEPAIDDVNRIPKEERTYTITIKVGNMDEMDQAYLETARWYPSIYAPSGDERVIGKETRLTESASITIPENKTGETRSIELSLSNSLVKVYYQKGK